jgi:hypothetical protein
VSEVERGGHNPTVDLMDRLSEMVGRTVGQLFRNWNFSGYGFEGRFIAEAVVRLWQWVTQ